MNETNSECEKAFIKFATVTGCRSAVYMYEKKGFEEAWNLQQSRITSLQSDNQKLREALKMLSNGDCWCDVSIGHPLMNDHSNICKIAKAALAETKQEEK